MAESFMDHYKYLIVGGGMAGDAAAGGIRELDQNGTIGMFTQEADPPYNRPPLTKDLWKGRPVERIWRKTQAKGVDLLLSHSVASIDPTQNRVIDQAGKSYTYDRMLIATGGRPRTLPGDSSQGDDRIIYFRTYRDYQRLRQLADQVQHFVIVGGGYIGSELAAALASSGKHVSLVMRSETVNGAKLPPELGRFLNDYYRDRGVELFPGLKATAVEARGDRRVLRAEPVSGGEPQEIAGDAVVLGLGIEPNVELAQDAGLEVDKGVVVDQHLRTSHPGIYAAGDVASVYKPALGNHMRIEHEDNANSMGRHAGRSMAGDETPFEYQPFFYSDMFDLGYEAVGEMSPKLEMVPDWQAPYRKGVIYYLGEGRVRGVLLWGIFGKVDAARQLIADAGPFRAEDLRGRIQP